jgi:hypothetical protein
MKFKTPAAMFTISYHTFFIRGFNRNPENLLDMEKQIERQQTNGLSFSNG